MPKSKEKTNNQKQGRNPKSDNCDWWNPDCMHFCDAKYAPLTGERKEAAADCERDSCCSERKSGVAWIRSAGGYGGTGGECRCRFNGSACRFPNVAGG